MLLLLKQSNIKELNETESSKASQRNIVLQEKKLFYKISHLSYLDIGPEKWERNQDKVTIQRFGNKCFQYKKAHP